ncbi:nodulation protein S (NodS) [Kribbella steppae]|uniref:Nodulation protein S (NodS) n=1 Tax=Kribbella steppae TaxID=2512223 RepID=A0A4V6NMV7_9ACTN|nr:SAM-dependent methyltransferase [Kribbella steppae]TCO15447.1 nodulation protein S (NodS) [Kribbella steppae]
MIDVLAVLRPEDAVTDFLSVLDPAHGREVHLVAAERGVYLKLPAGIPLEGRLAAIAALHASSGESDKAFSPATAAAAIALEAGAIPFTVWTHHPWDTRTTHGRWALDITAAVGGPVRHTLPAGAPVVLDPVEVAASPYEQERLRATVEWVRRHLDPIAGRMIEVGAHEGALTQRLLADGYSVDATEPNELLLERLRSNVAGDVRIHPHSFEDLATTARLTGSAYLLIEVLYYGQDLSLLDRFPTDHLFVAMEAGELARQVWPAAWSVEEEIELVASRLEELAGALLRKRGSRGVLLRRR